MPEKVGFSITRVNEKVAGGGGGEAGDGEGDIMINISRSLCCHFFIQQEGERVIQSKMPLTPSRKKISECPPTGMPLFSHHCLASCSP